LSDPSRPTARFGFPGYVNAQHLFTVWRPHSSPASWLPTLASYERIFVPSKWNLDVFRQAGVPHVSYVPFGHESGRVSSLGIEI